MTSEEQSKRRVEYLPPSKEIIEDYVDRLCQRLAQQDAAFADPDVVQGLAEFLYLAGCIRAKQLNRENQVDNESD